MPAIHKTPSTDQNNKLKKMQKNEKKSKNVQEKRKFKSKFHDSMSVMFNKELETRRNSKVQLIRNGTKNKFYAIDAHGSRVTLNGNYAYVTKVDGEIVAWPKSVTGHNDTCHFALSDFAKEVDYAGEVIFSPYKETKPEYGKCDEHNNASGTYKPEAEHDFQSGLPIETFKLPNFSY